MVTDSLISGINGNNGSCVISAKIDHGNSGGGDNGHFEWLFSGYSYSDSLRIWSLWPSHWD